MQIDTGFYEGLAAQVAEMEARLAEVSRLHQIVLYVTGAGGLPPARQEGKPAAPKRDRHGMRLIRGEGTSACR
jgi:hypothetical protein